MHGLVAEVVSPMLLEALDRVEDVFLGLATEARQIDEPILMAGVLQFPYRRDPEMVVNSLPLFLPHAPAGQHLQQSARALLFQGRVEGRTVAGRQITAFVRQ